MASEAETYRMRTPSGGQSSITVERTERGPQISFRRDGEPSHVVRLSLDAAGWLADRLAALRDRENRDEG